MLPSPVNNHPKSEAEKSWAFLDSTEEAAKARLAPSLEGFRSLSWNLWSAAWFAQFVPVVGAEAMTPRSESNRLAGILLKRVMTDFRAIWCTVKIGYTTQAACVAAAMFENALLLAAIASNPTRTRQVLSQGPEQIPWGVKELCRFDAERLADEYQEAGSNRGVRIKTGTDALYATYQWLCQLKHPTLPSALHDSGGTKVASGFYIIAVAPDTRDEDLLLKKHVLLVSASRARDAIEAFLRSHVPDTTAKEYADVKELLRRADEKIVEEIRSQQKSGPLPVMLPPSKRGGIRR